MGRRAPRARRRGSRSDVQAIPAPSGSVSSSRRDGQREQVRAVRSAVLHRRERQDVPVASSRRDFLPDERSAQHPTSPALDHVGCRAALCPRIRIRSSACRPCSPCKYPRSRQLPRRRRCAAEVPFPDRWPACTRSLGVRTSAYVGERLDARAAVVSYSTRCSRSAKRRALPDRERADPRESLRTQLRWPRAGAVPGRFALSNVPRALVTGCGKRNGIGAACALALARSGSDVAVTDIAPAGVRNSSERPADWDMTWGGLPELVSAIESEGRRAIALLGDISSEADAKRMVDETVAAARRSGHLVNNAAAPQGPRVGRHRGIPLDAFDRVSRSICAHLPDVSRGGPHMRHALGRIINMCRTAVRRGTRVRSRTTARKAASSGSRAASRGCGVAGDHGERGVPGAILTSRAINSVRRSEARAGRR